MCVGITCVGGGGGGGIVIPWFKMNYSWQCVVFKVGGLYNVIGALGIYAWYDVPVVPPVIYRSIIIYHCLLKLPNDPMEPTAIAIFPLYD